LIQSGKLRFFIVYVAMTTHSLDTLHSVLSKLSDLK